GAPALSRVDSTIDFDWVTGSPDTSFINTNTFTVRWSGQLQPEWPQHYTFYTLTDDGVRLWVNGQLVINSWINQGATERNGSITLTTNLQDIIMEYYENTGNAVAKLSWSSASQVKGIIPMSQLYPATAAVQPTLQVTTSNTNLVLNWGPGSYPLLWATNVS